MEQKALRGAACYTGPAFHIPYFNEIIIKLKYYKDNVLEKDNDKKLQKYNAA